MFGSALRILGWLPTDGSGTHDNFFFPLSGFHVRSGLRSIRLCTRPTLCQMLCGRKSVCTVLYRCMILRTDGPSYQNKGVTVDDASDLDKPPTSQQRFSNEIHSSSSVAKKNFLFLPFSNFRTDWVLHWLPKQCGRCRKGGRSSGPRSISTTSTYKSGLELTGVEERNQADESKQSFGWMWLVAELFHFAPENVWCTILNIMNTILRNRAIPCAWHKTLFQLLPNERSKVTADSRPSQTSASCTKFLHIDSWTRWSTVGTLAVWGAAWVYKKSQDWRALLDC